MRLEVAGGHPRMGGDVYLMFGVQPGFLGRNGVDRDVDCITCECEYGSDTGAGPLCPPRDRPPGVRVNHAPTRQGEHHHRNRDQGTGVKNSGKSARSVNVRGVP
eukprot:892846-Prorocentrum_minimum.AAC.4